MSFLVDSYVKSGSSFDDFQKALTEMHEKTKYLEVNTKEMELLSIRGISEDQDGNQWLLVNHNIPGQETALRQRLSLEKIRRNVSEDLIQELSNTKLLVQANGKLLFTSQFMMTTLESRVKIGGSSVSNSSLKRDEYINELFDSMHLPVKLLYREENSIKKIFSVHSEKYAEIPQNILPQIVEALSDLGTVKCEGWEITHDMTWVWVSFPDKAKEISDFYHLPDIIVPTLYLGTSDTGAASVTAIGKLQIDRSNATQHIYRHKHMGDLTPDSVVEEIKKTIFAHYTQMPERLCELLTIPVSDPKKVVYSVFRQVHMGKAIGRKLAISLKRQLCNEFVEGQPYTAYDVAMGILTMPQRCLGISKSLQNKLEEATTKAVFANYKQLEEKEETNPILVA